MSRGSQQLEGTELVLAVLLPLLATTLLALLLGEPLTASLVIAGSLMALGIWLHLTEHHEHAHGHVLIEHEHEHIHDEHHQHEHGAQDSTVKRHSHRHHHVALTHSHAHFPDAHHDHDHR